MFPFSIANAVVGAESDEKGRQYAFNVQILSVYMTRFGEICSVVVATFYQISRSAIKKAGDFWPISAGMRLRKSCPVIITEAGNGSTHTGWLTAIHHIVSTAVPALVAEPAIDILLQVESLAALDSVNDKMHDMRSTPRGENGITGRRYCSKRTMHLTGDQAVGVQRFPAQTSWCCSAQSNARSQQAKPGGLWPVENEYLAA